MRLCVIAMREWKRGMHGRAVTRGRVGASTRCDVRVDRVQSEPGQSQRRLCWMLLEDDARVGRMDPAHSASPDVLGFLIFDPSLILCHRTSPSYTIPGPQGAQRW